jgi:hypothetical protein
MLWRVSGALNQLLACGIVRRVKDGTLELRISTVRAVFFRAARLVVGLIADEAAARTAVQTAVSGP